MFKGSEILLMVAVTVLAVIAAYWLFVTTMQAAADVALKLFGG